MKKKINKKVKAKEVSLTELWSLFISGSLFSLLGALQMYILDRPISIIVLIICSIASIELYYIWFLRMPGDGTISEVMELLQLKVMVGFITIIFIGIGCIIYEIFKNPKIFFIIITILGATIGIILAIVLYTYLNVLIARKILGKKCKV